MPNDKVNMDHMKFLGSVAQSDVDVLEKKEGTYQGSWKAAGGRSAWFMARRNMDRLLTMMAPKQFHDSITTPANVNATLQALEDWVHYGQKVTKLPGSIEATMAVISMVRDRFTAEDIFAKIEEKPDGSDGTVLACIRDLRRYLILVEAEMMSRGVVTSEGDAPVEVESKPAPAPQPASKPIPSWTGANVVDRFLATSTLPSAAPIEVEQKPVSTASTLPKPAPIEDAPSKSPYQGVAMKAELTVTPANTRENIVDNLAAELLKGDDVSDAEVENAIREAISMPPVVTSPASGGTEQAEHPPWLVGQDFIDRMRARVPDSVDNFYRLRAPGVYQLDSVVLSKTAPRECASQFKYISSMRWVLRREDVPAEIDANFPKLQNEMNEFEYSQSPTEFQFMYEHDEGAQKWRLMSQFSAWSREG